MNSLEQLNLFSSTSLDYGDEADFSISLLFLGNKTISGPEGQDHTLPLGMSLLEMISAPSTVFYQIDLSSALEGVYVQWPTLPEGVVESFPSSRVSRLTGVSTLSIWEIVKQPIIVVPRDTSGDFSYTVTFNAGVGNIITWTVSVSLSAETELNTLTPNAIVYNEDETKDFGEDNVIQITDSENPETDYYILIAEFPTAAGTLTSTINPQTAISDQGYVAISGPRSSINGFLRGMQFVPAPDYDQSFTITWTLNNPVAGAGGLQTTATQLVNIGIKNEEIDEMYLTRTYVEQEYNLLFASTVPQIPEDVPGVLYTMSFQLLSNIGVIGTDFADPRWNSTTKTFLATGLTKTQANALFYQLYFWPFSDINSNSTVTYRQTRNGTLQIVQNFTLQGIPNAVRMVTSPSQTVLEDARFSAGAQEVYPNWDQPSWAMRLEILQNGSPSTAVGKFDLPTGWNYIGNAQVHSGIYKNFTESANLVAFESDVGQATTNAFITLTADYTTAFTINRTLNIGGFYDGSEFINGTNYYGNSNVTVTGHAEYNITNPLIYEEDNILTFGNNISITDLALNKQYSTTVRLPNTAVGSLWYGNVNRGNTYTFIGPKETVNSQMSNLEFRPVSNGFANTVVYYTQTQTTDNITQANNVTTPLNSTGNLPEPIISNWSYTNSTASTNNNIDGFSVTQTISGAAGYPIDANTVVVTPVAVTNVLSQPIISSIDSVQSGNDAVVTMNGYWPLKYSNSGAVLSNFSTTTTANNNKNQIATTVKPAYLHTDWISTNQGDTNAGINAGVAQGIVWPTGTMGNTNAHVFYQFTAVHRTSYVVPNFVTKLAFLEPANWVGIVGYSCVAWVCRTEDIGTVPSSTLPNFLGLPQTATGSLQAGKAEFIKSQNAYFEPIISDVVGLGATAGYPSGTVGQNFTVVIRYGTGNPVPKGGYLQAWKSNLIHSPFTDRALFSAQSNY